MTTTGLTVTIIPNDRNNPPGKLADAEIHFALPDLPELDTLSAITYGKDQHAAKAIQAAIAMLRTLNGLRLIGFSIWERRTGGGRNVTFPARQYSVNGERRSFALLRPTTDAAAQDRIREAILDAYAAYEEQATRANESTSTKQPATAGASLFA